MVPNINCAAGVKNKKKQKPSKIKPETTQCVIQYPTNRNTAQSAQEKAITVFGSCL